MVDVLCRKDQLSIERNPLIYLSKSPTSKGVWPEEEGVIAPRRYRQIPDSGTVADGVVYL